MPTMPVTDLLDDLVSPRVGVVQSVDRMCPYPGEPPMVRLASATLAHFAYRRLPDAERVGAGKGLTDAEARAGAIGEAVERYCAYQPDPHRLFIAPATEAGPGAVRPVDLVLYSDDQCGRPAWRYQRWSDDLPVAWVRGVELGSGAETAAPAGLTWLAGTFTPSFTATTSNGLAAGPDRPSALLGGLCELIERDAFLLTWMNRLPAVEVDLATAGGAVAAIAGHYARRGVDVRAFLLPSDLPAAAVMAVSFDDDDDPDVPAQVVGLGCHPDPAVAVLKAVLEMCQARPSEISHFRDDPPAGRLRDYADVATLEDHSAFAGQRERRDEFAFLWASGRRTAVADIPDPSVGDVAGDLDGCVATLAAAGLRVVAVDLTLPDVAQCGVHVERVMIPGLQPIHFGFGEERLGGTRLFEVPRSLGLSARPRTEADLNPCPHPLA